MSGMSVSDELYGLYEEMKLRRKYKFIVFGLAKTGMDGNKAVYDWKIDTAQEARRGDDVDNQAAWRAMLERLPQDDGRFALFDWSAKASDGRNIAKIVLVKWCPDTANVNVKMMLGSTHQTLKQKFQGLSKDVQAVDPSDLEYKGVASGLVA